jgi:hypothetical protein
MNFRDSVSEIQNYLNEYTQPKYQLNMTSYFNLLTITFNRVVKLVTKAYVHRDHGGSNTTERIIHR